MNRALRLKDTCDHVVVRVLQFTDTVILPAVQRVVRVEWQPLASPGSAAANDDQTHDRRASGSHAAAARAFTGALWLLQQIMVIFTVSIRLAYEVAAINPWISLRSYFAGFQSAWKGALRTTLALLLLGASTGVTAFTAPAVGDFGYDIYDIVVNQILNGPIGFIGGVALIVFGATKIMTNWMLTILCIIAGTILIRAADLVVTLGAMI